MNYKIQNAAISFGDNTLLEEINFEVNTTDKIAIVGRNGCGKTTFLKALIDNDMFEEGIGQNKFQIVRQNNLSIGYLKQIQFKDETISMEEEIRSVYKDIIELEEKLKSIQKQMESNIDETKAQNLATEYSKTLERFEALDGYTYKKEYETAILKFGFSKEDMQKQIKDFSGGQKTKIALIRLILSKPDLLILDEPTNHLDVTTIEWLEKYLSRYKNALIIVSHDRMFLDKIVNKVYEIEYAAFTLYTGNYSSYEIQKKERYEKQLKDYEYQQAEIKRLRQIADRFRYKPTKAKMALSKLKQIERMDIVDRPNRYDTRSFTKNFKLKETSGKLVLKTEELKFGYKEPLGVTSFELFRGDTLGIIGANGKGKSTLLKTLMEKIPKLGGHFSFGFNVDKEYFDQELSFKDENATVIEDFENEFKNMTTTDIRSALASFMFYADDVEKQIKDLSGGQKVRLELCKIIRKGPNTLLLDEPTNHMDIIGKETLERLLQAYEGTTIVVSHDRYFINKIANCLLIFEEDKVRFFRGTYNEYLEEREKEEITKDEKASQKENKKEEQITDTKAQYLESKERNKIQTKIKRLEEQIDRNETKINEIRKEMEKEENMTSYTKLAELQEEINKIEEENENKLSEWEELNAKL
ncbi:MAG: ABC-F family ATP-binding cassette domain-containing protein [Clostridia bacterium]|nr:ABC-F family ATP-binding cassette domain-containing protein [Clostridia bacterium]